MGPAGLAMPRSKSQSQEDPLPGTERCELCHRQVPSRLTNIHHLVPRSKGGGPEEQATLCKMCHSFIHATFTNRTLATAFPTIESLREDPEVQKFIRWVRKQKPHRRLKTDRREEKR
jgi:hypothetical protein